MRDVFSHSSAGARSRNDGSREGVCTLPLSIEGMRHRIPPSPVRSRSQLEGLPVTHRERFETVVADVGRERDARLEGRRSMRMDLHRLFLRGSYRKLQHGIQDRHGLVDGFPTFVFRSRQVRTRFASVHESCEEERRAVGCHPYLLRSRILRISGDSHGGGGDRRREDPFRCERTGFDRYDCGVMSDR